MGLCGGQIPRGEAEEGELGRHLAAGDLAVAPDVVYAQKVLSNQHQPVREQNVGHPKAICRHGYLQPPGHAAPRPDPRDDVLGPLHADLGSDVDEQVVVRVEEAEVREMSVQVCMYAVLEVVFPAVASVQVELAHTRVARVLEVRQTVLWICIPVADEMH
ncbi:hypothetical protein TRICI_006542 [Trichomonascus ciferrii]|uniref:Uncharacterized protein n=1 Tax=Trichomonascus ciferrii TaxID=44093 RepID=A0A642UGC0_9ASCO|nr:hypothetical protein TRICI_006542 [Trichomonascus ciferrii]